MPTITELLQKYWGYTSFLPHQEEVITSVLNGNDTLAVMATGAGKSLCYQLPALFLGGVTIVISPLISLMKNQVDDLNERGINAAAYNSSLEYHERTQVERDLVNNTLRLLFISPEKCMQPNFLNFISQFPVHLIAVDEAHCISEWGHNFRPEYHQLSSLKQHFPSVPIIALTATATSAVREDIVAQLQLSDVHEYIGSFNRHNLHYRVVPKRKPFNFILDYIEQHPDSSGIIYCFSRKETDDLSEALVEHGYMACAYHAGLPDEFRKKVQEAFLKDEVRIICATVAFGMGIDKPDVRYVIHYDLPKSVEAYYQETGRAGRDGQPSECILLYNRADNWKVRSLIERDEQDQHQMRIAFKKLQEMVDYCETNSCRRKYLLSYFGEEYPGETCGSCDVCDHPLELFDGTEVAQNIIGCVQQLRTKYGAAMIAGILLGSRKAEITRLNFDRLPVYASGKEHDRNSYLTWINDLVRQGYLSRTGDKYPVIGLTEKSEEILAGHSRVMLPLPRQMKQRQSVIANLDAMLPEEKELFLLLKDIRKNVAEQQNVMPYMIFSDKTLRLMAHTRPCDDASFRTISGVGDYKLETFGPVFIPAIKDFVQRHETMAPSPDVGAITSPTVSPHNGTGSEGTILEQIFQIDREIRRIKEEINRISRPYNEQIKDLDEIRSALLDEAVTSGIEKQGNYSLRCSITRVRQLDMEEFKHRYPDVFMKVGKVLLKDVDLILGKDVVTGLCTIKESKSFKVCENDR